MDDVAASPLTVIAVAVALTALLVGGGVYLLRGDGPTPWDVDADPVQRAFVVVSAPAASWSEVEVQLLNAGGTDRADVYLDVPAGEVRDGQVLALVGDPPAGPYMLRILSGGSEVARATLVL